jgi:hypothetical protein
MTDSTDGPSAYRSGSGFAQRLVDVPEIGILLAVLVAFRIFASINLLLHSLDVVLEY